MALSENIKTKINGMRGNFPTEQALLLPLLHSIQEERGWVSLDSMKEAAEFLHLPLMKVREVVTFYTMYNQKPVGKAHIQICANISCWLKGADHLIECAEKKLGIKPGETTADGKFTLSEVECLGACGTAPALQMNEEYFENLSAEKLTTLIDEWSKEIDQAKADLGKVKL